jgi:hypothetical protein
MELDAFKKKIVESLNAPLGMAEKLDPHVDELAGSLIAAGPQKCAEAIGKMDPATFTEFCKKIDAQGILMITKQFAAGAAPAAPAAGGAPAPEGGAGAAPAAAPVAPPQQDLKDL